MMMCFFRFFDRKNDIVHKYEVITLCISTNRNFIFRKYVLTAEFLYSLLTFFTLKCIIFTKIKLLFLQYFITLKEGFIMATTKKTTAKTAPAKTAPVKEEPVKRLLQRLSLLRLLLQLQRRLNPQRQKM